jgi:hypothetical protein
LNSQKQITIQELLDKISEKQESVVNVKFQNIIYYMNNNVKKISQKQNVQIDFIKAVNEMNELDWNYEENFIGFDNLSKHECVQFIRQGDDKWYAEVPIKHGMKWDGYAWCSYTNSKIVTDLLRLFFEEVPWFGMLSWKMRRFKH